MSKSGESTTTKTTLKVDTALPMITEITWNSGGPSNWKERTIKQGSIMNDQDDSSRITLVFDQLKFQKATGCTPVSGAINGKVYNQTTDADPVVTFVISFAGGVGSIVWSSGETTSYSPSNCSLDD